jgi:sulfur relay (sulfurtransferase) complex TusBCD TusD component (DsrE family)
VLSGMWSTDGAQIVAEGRRDVSGLTSPLSGHSIARFCSERARGPTWAARVDVPEVDVPVEDGVPLAVLFGTRGASLTGCNGVWAAASGWGRRCVVLRAPAALPPRRHRGNRCARHPGYSPAGMKVAYVFSTSGHTASYKLGRMILPQLEQGTHGVEVVGMFFFDDNTYVLRAGDPVGERLGRVAAEHGMLLMLCDQCALERGLAEGEIGAALPTGTVAGVRVGCFPDLYAALAGDPPDHVITL